MKNTILLIHAFVLLGCTSKSDVVEETLAPTAAEKRIITAANTFFKNGGDYYKIINNYRVTLRPVLTVRRALTEGPCTNNIFQNDCCCPWLFSLTPYDQTGGTTIDYVYPKTSLFTAKAGKMEGAIIADFPTRPTSSTQTEIQYDFLAFIGDSNPNLISNPNLNGRVIVRNVFVSPSTNNVMCTAEFSDNTFAIASGMISSSSGHLIFTEGDASGSLDITYTDGKRVVTELFLSAIPPGSYAGFLQSAVFTTEGITSQIDINRQTITIGNRTFKLSLW